VEKQGFIYIWYDRKRKMFYIGCHWGTIDDGYICSSNRMRDAYRRRPTDFKRRIIQTHILRETLLEEENKWLQLIPNDQMGKKYYNLSKKHFGHWTTNPETRLSCSQKISLAKKGKSLSEEHRRKLSNAVKKYFSLNPHNHLGSHASEETKKKLSQANLGKKRVPFSEEHRRKMSVAQKKYNLTNPNNFYGKKHSEETKKKLRNSHLGQIPWNKKVGEL